MPLHGKGRTEVPVHSDRALCSRHTATAAASAPQHIRDTHRDDGTGHRAGEIRPPRGPVTLHQGRTERPSRVHRRPADRRGPQPGERDIGAHPDSSQRPDLLSTRCGAQDHAHQPGSQDHFPQHRGSRRDTGSWQGQPCAALLAEKRPQHQRRQGGAYELGGDVRRDALPREVASCREGHAHRRVQVRTGDGPHEQDDGGHH